MTDEIRTARLVLRRWREQDRQPFAAMNADEQVMRYFPAALDEQASDALIDRIEAHFDAHGYGLWALASGGELLGFTGLSWMSWHSAFTPAVEIGWRLRRSAWGRGYASEAATAALAHGLHEVDTIVNFTTVSNERSQRVMQRIGMRFDRTFEHPNVTTEHALRPHVLYRADAATWAPPDTARWSQPVAT